MPDFRHLFISGIGFESPSRYTRKRPESLIFTRFSGFFFFSKYASNLAHMTHIHKKIWPKFGPKFGPEFCRAYSFPFINFPISFAICFFASSMSSA